jgi:hypothetical protein
MALQQPSTKFSGTLDYEAKRIHFSNPYVIAFGEGRTDLWKLSFDGCSIEKKYSFSEPIEDPASEGVIIDTKRDFVVFPKGMLVPPALRVYGLSDGRFIRTVPLFGELAQWPMQYCDGHVLVTVREAETDAPPDGRTSILLCDVAGDGWLLSATNLPSDLTQRDQMPFNLIGSLVPILLTSNGDIVATSSACYEEKMSLMLWKGTGTAFEDNVPPDLTVQVAISSEPPEGSAEGFADGDNIRPSCSIPLDKTSFLLCTYEHVSDALETAFSAQSTIRAFEILSLHERWCAKPIWGHVKTIQYVNSHDVIVAIGTRDEREGGGNSDMSTIVVALDAMSGALRFADKVNHYKQGSAVKHCALGQTENRPLTIIVLLANGAISITPLGEFLTSGFARDGQSIQVTRHLEGNARVGIGAVSGQSAILLTKGSSDFSLVSW